MKKLILLLSFCLFFILPVSALADYSQGDIENVEAESAEAESTESADLMTRKKQVDYTLPYPGILPDSPLYWIKALRDNIIAFLISDPLKKAEFDLLQADKRLQSGVYLLQKDVKKAQLAQETISKGQNYFEEAIGKVKEARKQKKDAKDIERRLPLSARKHIEVLTRLIEQVGENDKEKFAALLTRMQKLEKSVNSIY